MSRVDLIRDHVNRQEGAQLEPPYQMYTAQHPIRTLLNGPHKAQALQNSRSSLTRAWDFPSLLIKPVQRLVTVVIDDTPDDHPDKGNLIKAKMSTEDVARGVNGGQGEGIEGSPHW